jgi:predicted PhzF superfamily epimerase YddE/YHI9
MTVPLFHVDGFTDQPFAGNPAAVAKEVLLAEFGGR